MPKAVLHVKKSVGPWRGTKQSAGGPDYCFAGRNKCALSSPNHPPECKRPAPHRTGLFAIWRLDQRAAMAAFFCAGATGFMASGRLRFWRAQGRLGAGLAEAVVIADFSQRCDLVIFFPIHAPKFFRRLG